MTDLTCWEGDNVAAVALMLQQTALESEAEIFDLERQLRAAANRPTMVQTSTAAITNLGAGVDVTIGPIGGGNFVTNFNNTGYDRNIDTSGRQQYGNSNGSGEGLYQFGLYVNAVAAGAVSDNTYRMLEIQQARLLPAGEVVVARSMRILYETNTGVGTDISVTAEFSMLGTDRVRFLFSHGNVASLMNVSIGTVIWSTKLSSPDGVVIN